jgi:hypothetical protein
MSQYIIVVLPHMGHFNPVGGRMQEYYIYQTLWLTNMSILAHVFVYELVARVDHHSHHGTANMKALCR